MKPRDPSSPPSLGGYRLLAELGGGGMGKAHLAGGRDGGLVAVKQIHGHLISLDGFRARFREEVRASQRVASSPYTASVVAADTEAEAPWLATEFVFGPTLAEALAAAGPLDEGSFVRLAAGLASALETVHDAGIVHRDLKPSNVLLADEGVKVIDFGVSRALD